MQSFEEVTHFLFNELPVFQRDGEVAINKKLNVISKLCETFNQPQSKYPVIHVAGTNGKGTTAHFLSSVLIENDFKVGVFSSPHLKSFTERIKVNNELVSEDWVIEFVNRHYALIKSVCPTFFELTTLMAFEYFKDKHVDVAVIEVGLGGRWDATNIVDPELSIITSISLDHQKFLGDTLSKIAFEKGGIVKEGKPTVLALNKPEVVSTIETICQDRSSKLYKVSKLCHDLPEGPLLGDYLKENWATVLLSVDVLVSLGWDIKKPVDQAFTNVVQNTGLKGRWQILQNDPLVICDTGHNVDAVEKIIAQLGKYDHNNQLHIVWGMANDKDVDAIVKLLPKVAKYYLCEPDLPRAMSLNKLEAYFLGAELSFVACASVMEAYKEALRNCNHNDVVFVGGSTFVVAELENL